VGKNQPEKLFTYNHSNQLTGISQGGTNYSYAYNGFGDRLRQTAGGNTVNYVIDSSSGLSQVLADGTNTYLYGLDRISQSYADGKDYFLGDALGSVRQMANTSGGITLSRNYEPYGTIYSAMGISNTAYGFTSEWTDGTGLVNLRARYYAPVSGRFMSTDSWKGNQNQPISYNKWVYAYANPIVYSDPTGLITQGDEDKTATAILNDLKSRFGVVIIKDWGVISVPDIWHYTYHCGWLTGNWRNVHELELTQDAVEDMAEKVGGIDKFKSAMKWQVLIRRNLDSPNSGLAFIDVSLFDGAFNSGDAYAKEVVVHELAHVWDIRNWYSISLNMMDITNSYRLNCRKNSDGIEYCNIVYDTTNAIEKAPTKYAETNGAEDWAESVMVYIYPSSGNLKSIRRGYIEEVIQNIH